MDKLDTVFWLLCTNYVLIIVLIGAVGYKIDKLETRIRRLEQKSNEIDKGTTEE